MAKTRRKHQARNIVRVVRDGGLFRFSRIVNGGVTQSVESLFPDRNGKKRKTISVALSNIASKLMKRKILFAYGEP